MLIKKEVRILNKVRDHKNITELECSGTDGWIENSEGIKIKQSLYYMVFKYHNEQVLYDIVKTT
jgi:serine/threonine protein kinase